MLSPRVLAVALLTVLGAGAAAVAGTSPAGSPASAAPVSPAPTRAGAVAGSAAGAGAGAGVATSGLDVRAENQRAGTPGWSIPAAATASGIRAYATVTSVLPGRPVPLAVSARGPVSVRALRIGWYSGALARQVWRGTLAAGQQSGDPGNWSVSGSIGTAGWPEGHYLIRLDRGRAARYVPLTVRSADVRDRVLVLTSPMTWLAGTAGRAHRTSFDHPYPGGFGAGGFLRDDAGVLEQAERTGARLAYATDLDVATDPGLVSGAAAIVTGSDSRFWTAAARTAVQAAAGAGTNLAFFGAGTGSRTVTVADAGRALVIARAAPSPSVRMTGVRPSCARTLAATPPDPTGWRVAGAGWWGYRGTGVRTGDVLPGLVGDRADHASLSAPGSPQPLQVLSFAALTCGSQYSAQSAVYAVRPSLAGVFTAGTDRWACAITGACLKRLDPPSDPAIQAFVTRVTGNVLRAFSVPRAGSRYPARNTAAKYPALR